MARFNAIYLDSGPLGLLARRPGTPVVDACRSWFEARCAAGFRIMIPEVADYETRRELLRLGATASVQRLDALSRHPNADFLRINPRSMRQAARFWADLRRGGKPTADPHALDGDVILAAQLVIRERNPARAVVATGNARHLSRLVNCDEWPNIA